jgi:hypothetical protein
VTGRGRLLVEGGGRVDEGRVDGRQLDGHATEGSEPRP